MCESVCVCVCLCEDVDVIGSDSMEMICLEVINISEVLSGGRPPHFLSAGSLQAMEREKNAVSLSKLFRPYSRF